MTKNERLKEAVKEIKYRYGITQKEIVAKIGLSSATYLSDLIRGKSELSELFIDKLTTTYPEINRVWLLTGEGEMLNESSNQTKNEKLSESDAIEKLINTIDTLNSIIRQQAEEINTLRKQISQRERGKGENTLDANSPNYVDVM